MFSVPPQTCIFQKPHSPLITQAFCVTSGECGFWKIQQFTRHEGFNKRQAARLDKRSTCLLSKLWPLFWKSPHLTVTFWTCNTRLLACTWMLLPDCFCWDFFFPGLMQFRDSVAQYYCRYLNEISFPGGCNMLHYSEAQCEILCYLHLISSSLAFKENPKWLSFQHYLQVSLALAFTFCNYTAEISNTIRDFQNASVFCHLWTIYILPSDFTADAAAAWVVAPLRLLESCQDQI